MAPSSDCTEEAIGEGGVGGGEADGLDVVREGDGLTEVDECNVTLGAFLTIAVVGDDLVHGADLSLRGVGVQLVGAQLYLIVILAVLTGGRGAMTGTQEISLVFLIPVAPSPRF